MNKVKQKGAGSQVAPVVDSIVCLAANVVPDGVPSEECGIACTWAVEHESRWDAHQVLGYAATHTGGGRGTFLGPGNFNVIVVSDRPLIQGVHEAAAVWAIRFFESYTESLEATRMVRWLPLLFGGVKDRLPQLISREVELARQDGGDREPFILLWGSNGGVAVETAHEIGRAIFGFVATIENKRR